MSVELSKFQKQELGEILGQNGFSPKDDFLYEDKNGENEQLDTASLICRESSDYFRIMRGGTGGQYFTTFSVPGTNREKRSTSSVAWSGITSRLSHWADELKKENEAIDPWRKEAEDMANDDTYFTIDELPKVDKAIEESLEDLKQKAIDHGKKVEQIQDQLDDMQLLLQKTARSSTKREWMSIFKSVIVDKLVDWGMKTAIFQSVLQTLVTSARDIAQIAEHASRHLP